jgi:hypothetical protein
MLEFVEEHTPLRFSLIPESDAATLELERCANGRRPPIETLGSQGMWLATDQVQAFGTSSESRAPSRMR